MPFDGPAPPTVTRPPGTISAVYCTFPVATTRPVRAAIATAAVVASLWERVAARASTRVYFGAPAVLTSNPAREVGVVDVPTTADCATGSQPRTVTLVSPSPTCRAENEMTSMPDRDRDGLGAGCAAGDRRPHRERVARDAPVAAGALRDLVDQAQGRVVAQRVLHGRRRQVDRAEREPRLLDQARHDVLVRDVGERLDVRVPQQVVPAVLDDHRQGGTAVPVHLAGDRRDRAVEDGAEQVVVAGGHRHGLPDVQLARPHDGVVVVDERQRAPPDRAQPQLHPHLEDLVVVGELDALGGDLEVHRLVSDHRARHESSFGIVSIDPGRSASGSAIALAEASRRHFVESP